MTFKVLCFQIKRSLCFLFLFIFIYTLVCIRARNVSIYTTPIYNLIPSPKIIEGCEHGVVYALAHALDLDYKVLRDFVNKTFNKLLPDVVENEVTSINNSISHPMHRQSFAQGLSTSLILNLALYPAIRKQISPKPSLPTVSSPRFSSYDNWDNFDSESTDITKMLTDEDTTVPEWVSALDPALSHLSSSAFIKLYAEIFDMNHDKKVCIIRPQNLMTSICRAQEYSGQHATDQKDTCALMNILTAGLACREENDFNKTLCTLPHTPIYLPSACTPKTGPFAGQTLNTATYVPVFDFSDIRDTTPDHLVPMNIPTSYMEEEGLDYFFLYRATAVMLDYTHTIYPCNKTEFPDVVIPGWEVTTIVSYQSNNLKIAAEAPLNDVPLLGILRLKKDVQTATQNLCKAIVVVHGTANIFEWKMDIQFAITEFISPKSKVHEGFYQLASSVYTNLLHGLAALTDELIMEGVCNETTPMDIIVTGHSLGGALTQVLSVMLANTLSQQNQIRSHPAKVHAVSFASPNVFNEEGVNLYRHLVNGRNVFSDFDAISQMPCPSNEYPHGQYLCNGLVENNAGWQSYYGNAAKLSFSSVEALRNLNLPDDLLTPRLSHSTVQFPAPLQLAANHICAYSCWLSQKCVGPNPTIAWECINCSSKIEQIVF